MIPTPEDQLLIFIGHSRDAAEEAHAIYSIESELQRELDRMRAVAQGSIRYRQVKMWEWVCEAEPGVGGQTTLINPTIDRADIGLFVFKASVGPVTWDEMERCRSVTRNPHIPVIALFWGGQPDVRDRVAAKLWLELLDKKHSLSSDWNEPNSRSLRPNNDYRDTNELKILAKGLLIKAVDMCLRPACVKIETESQKALFTAFADRKFDQQEVMRAGV